MLQMDGSTHKWFGDSKSCLIATIDDADGEVFGKFFPSETSFGCLQVLKEVIKERGIFKMLYVDRAGLFGGQKRGNFSQVKRACEELGIEIIFANSPQGKGRIERVFHTLQDRLIPELRLAGIRNIGGANRFFQKKFLPSYWQKNCIVEPDNPISEYTPVPLSTNLSGIFVMKEYRKIRNDHTFSYGNKIYLLESKLRHSIAKQEIEIRINARGKIAAHFAGKKLIVSKVTEPSKPSAKDMEAKRKLEIIELASKIQNVSEAARQSGCSRQTIYNNRKILKEKGAGALKKNYNKNQSSKSIRSIERIVIDFSLKNPYLGQSQLFLHLKKECQLNVQYGSIRRIWLKFNMQTILLRTRAALKKSRPLPPRIPKKKIDR